METEATDLGKDLVAALHESVVTFGFRLNC